MAPGDARSDLDGGVAELGRGEPEDGRRAGPRRGGRRHRHVAFREDHGHVAFNPGIAPDVAAMPLGQGHARYGKFASGRGENPITLLPAGETYVAIESPRGEIGCYLASDGSGKPVRMHIRCPSFYNLQSIGPMGTGALVADAVAIVSSVDPIMGEVDR